MKFSIFSLLTLLPYLILITASPSTTSTSSSSIIDPSYNKTKPIAPKPNIFLRSPSYPPEIKAKRNVIPSRMTNAERIRRGLPLAKPKRLTRRGLSEPLPSCAPLLSDTGRLEVYKVSDNSFLGYVWSSYNPGFQSTLTNNIAQALSIRLPSTTPYYSSSPFAVEMLNGVDADYSWFGAVGGGAYDLSPGMADPGYTFLTGTGLTVAYALPNPNVPNSMKNGFGYEGPVESTIWSLSCDMCLNAQWINADGTQPVTNIMYNTRTNSLDLIGDIEAFRVKYPIEPVDLVYFKFVPGLVIP